MKREVLKICDEYSKTKMCVGGGKFKWKSKARGSGGDN